MIKESASHWTRADDGPSPSSSQSTKKRAFICYRKDDTDFAAYFLKSQLNEIFGDVFDIDVNLPIGENFAEAIVRQIDGSSALIVLIGPSWLRVHDEHHRRRIDDELDYVKMEIAHALNTAKRIIPVQIGSATMPVSAALPRPIEALAFQEAIQLEGHKWKDEFWRLVSKLVELKFTPIVERYKFPNVPKDRYSPVPLRDADVAVELENLTQGWQSQKSHRTGVQETEWHEIYREFKFRTFKDSIDFMARMVQHCDKVNHHPRWENVYDTLHVWLTTWDVGNRITIADIELAKAFDKAYESFLTS